ncbi:MAG: M6 family metalloprotease domain-containing protein [Candidatus Symbiothrix sp.]|jgi:M6 family metalloprotease-like protein|nr:M6 family metalloprotease domain-containing protein [Candidatus Symbiothrix sp.]
MKTRHYLFSLAVSLLLPITVFAVPAYPGLVKIKQPGGEEISVYLKGDEKVHWMESPDGHSLMYDSDKRIVFATTDETGNMIPSPIVFQDARLRSSATGKQIAGIPKNLRYSASQIKTLKEIWNLTGNLTENASLRAATGTVRAVCALVQFPDKSLVKTKEEFDQLLNQTGYSSDGAKGSVRDFYYENSYGQLDLTITVVGPYTATENLAYYGENDGNNKNRYAQELARDVASYTFGQSGINPADYDNDNDGYIDAFHFIYAGYGEEAGGGENTIWAHESGFSALNLDGKKLNVYSCSPELRGNSGSGITRIGVVCHEMGHIFGSPDYYDVDDAGGDFTGTGYWDLMASGSWNGGGSSPAHINMYQKIQLGWVNPTTLNTAQTITNMKGSAKNAIAYTYNTSVADEYYVLENRQQEGFDSYVPGPGLLIYHISVEDRDIAYNLVNNTHPQKVYPVCASSTSKTPDATPASYGNINSAGCPFPGTSGNTSFTDYTTPSAVTWKGTNSAKPITEISESEGMISFKFMQPGAEQVANFTLTRNGDSIQLRWDKPSANVLGYNIYRNDQFIIKLMGGDNTSYTQSNVSPGDYIYCVTAYYEQDESARNCQSVNIEGDPNEYPPINNLSATTGKNVVELTWDSPAQSDWVAHTNNPYEATYYAGLENFSAVVRFTEEDLSNFAGSKLSQVRFYIQNTSCKYTIQVWHFSGFPDTSPLISQVVENKAMGITTVNLNTPLTIESGKELWIGVNYQMSPMTTVAVRDRGPKIPDRNFVLSPEGWFDLSANDDFNWYISGYLQFDSNLGATGTNLPDKYSVYRNNMWLDDAMTGFYRDDVVPAGNYIYCVSAVYGNHESERVCIHTPVKTGIAGLNSGETKVYPNPVQTGNVLTIDVGNDFAGATLSFYSVSGQLLWEITVSGPVYHQKINQAPGIYILQIRKNAQIINRKIVVK